MQHAAGDKTAGKNEEKAVTAATSLPESEPYHWPGSRLRRSISHMEGSVVVGDLLYGSLTPGQNEFYTYFCFFILVT